MARSTQKTYILEIAAGTSSEQICIVDREFYARPVTINEALELDAVAHEGLEAQVDYLAGLLSKRAVDGEVVDSEWIKDNVPVRSMEAITQVLIHGEVRDPNA